MTDNLLFRKITVLALPSHLERDALGCATTVQINWGQIIIILPPVFALIRRVDV
jgi:hypothetical protein